MRHRSLDEIRRELAAIDEQSQRWAAFHGWLAQNDQASEKVRNGLDQARRGELTDGPRFSGEGEGPRRAR